MTCGHSTRADRDPARCSLCLAIEARRVGFGDAIGLTDRDVLALITDFAIDASDDAEHEVDDTPNDSIVSAQRAAGIVGVARPSLIAAIERDEIKVARTARFHGRAATYVRVGDVRAWAAKRSESTS